MQILQRNLSGLKTPSTILKEIRKFANSSQFKKFAESTAKKMVTHLFSDAGKTWREAAAKNGKGSEIYKALKKELETPLGKAVNEQIKRNARLIKTLPLDIAEQVTEHIAKESFKGRRPEDIAEEIKEMFPKTSNAKAELISRTETSKASSNLNQARSEQLGLSWYEWITSSDSRVRESHQLMDGVLIRWSEPPNPEKLNHEKRTYDNYHAGCIFNCRCYSASIVNIDFVKFPKKVYYQGKIQTMTKKQFLEIM